MSKGRNMTTKRIKPEPGQESVWDYPRPPRLEPVEGLLEVRHGDMLLASTSRAVRVAETASAATYYFPPDDVRADVVGSGGQALCEWKGLAESLTVGGVRDAGWRYIRVFPEFRDIHLWVAFYPARVDCSIDGEPVQPQPGGFYGGWVTRRLAGPIKGEPGSGSW